MKTRRVVITGYETLLPGISSKEELLMTLEKGNNKFAKASRASGIEDQEELVSEINNYEQYRQAQSVSEDERLVKFSKKLIDDMIKKNNINIFKNNSIGLSLATSVAGSIHVENYLREPKGKYCLRDMNLFAESIGKYINAKSVNVNICACAAGTIALGCAYDMVKYGENDLVFCIAAESLSQVTFYGFKGLKAISRSSCKPLTSERDGLTLGEGAAVIIVEEYEAALKRGARIYGEILGYGLSNDAYHISTPDPQGGGAVRAMKMALDEAGLSPCQIQYINLHGTGTTYNDAMESVALKKVFGDELRQINISSTKGLTGHCLAATGLIEVVITMTLLEKQLLPGNYNTQDEKIDDVFKGFLIDSKNVNRNINIFMSNSFAFAGNMSSIIIKRWCGNDGNSL